MRNLIEVIDNMLALIPPEEGMFRIALEELKESTSYTSPETLRFRWQCGANILQDSMPLKIQDFNDWQKKVIEVWTTRKYEELVAAEAGV